jgi:hypothetical protein
LEVTVILGDGSKKLVHSKAGGDGDVKPQNVAAVVQKVADAVA